MQLGALLYGRTIIYPQRPAFVVFGVDRFTSIPAAEVEFDQLQYPELQRRVGIGPLLAQVRPPADPQRRQELMFGVLQDLVLALSATDGMPAGWIPISPWLEDY